MRKEEYEKAFTEKIESFKNEPEYEILLQLSEKLLKRQTDQKQALETRSLMDRIIVMPKTYIKGWLRGENSLSYREEDKRMLQAFLGLTKGTHGHGNLPDIFCHVETVSI